MRKNMTIKINVPVVFKQDGDVYVGICPPLNVASQGVTPEEARGNLAEALREFLFTCIEMGTLSQVLKDCGFTEEKLLPDNDSDMEHMDVSLPFASDFNPAECHA